MASKRWRTETVHLNEDSCEDVIAAREAAGWCVRLFVPLPNGEFPCRALVVFEIYE